MGNCQLMLTISHVAAVGQPAAERDDRHLQTRAAKVAVLHFRKTFGHFLGDVECNWFGCELQRKKEDENIKSRCWDDAI